MAITVIIGPSNSGKSRFVINQASQSIARSKSSDLIILLPTLENTRSFPERLLLATDLPATVLPGIYSFSQLAEVIIENSGMEIHKISNLKSLYLINSIIENLIEIEKLTYHEKSARYPSFLNYVSGFISDMKQAEITPEELLERFSSVENKSMRELCQIYSEYQTYLTQRNLYDSEGVFWHALEIVDSGKPTLLDRINSIIMDGFTSFTEIQKSFIAALNRKIPQITVTLTYEDDPQRAELFEETAETLGFLRGLGAIIKKQTELDKNHSLYLLERSLFRINYNDHNASGQNSFFSEPVSLFKAPDIHTEVQAIASRIKRLILNDDADPERIAVIIPRVNDYRPQIEKIFNESGINYHFPRGTRIDNKPLVLFISQILDSAFTDIKRADFKNIVNSPFFRLVYDLFFEYSVKSAQTSDAGILDCKINPPETFSSLAYSMIEASAVKSGIYEWEKSLQQLSESETESVQKLVVDALLGFLALLKEIKKSRTISEASGIIFKILTIMDKNLRLLPIEAIKENWQILERLKTFFNNEMPALDSFVPIEKPKNIKDRLDLCMNQIVIPTKDKYFGKILITNPYDFRGREADYIFFAGLNDGSFPLYSKKSDSYYYDALRISDNFKQKLPRPMESAQDQMLLFYTNIVKASKHLTFSWVENDTTLPSIFISDLKDALGITDTEKILPLHRNPSLDMVNDLSGLYQYQILTKKSANKKDKKAAERKSLTEEKRNIIEHFRNLTELAQIENRRLSALPFDCYDGVLKADYNIIKINEHFRDGYTFSPSFFGDFGKCPFQFYARRILQAEPYEEKSEECTALDEGTFYHSILMRFYNEIKKSGKYKTIGDCLTASKELFKLLDEIIENYLSSLESNSKSIVSGYWKAQFDKYSKVLRRFVEFDFNESRDFSPLYLEYSFGMHSDKEDIDEDSTGKYLIVKKENEHLKIGGKVDRIDIREGEIRIIDYKRGREPKPQDILKGLDFQMPLYLLAIDQLIDKKILLNKKITAVYEIIRECDLTSKPYKIDKNKTILKEGGQIDLMVAVNSFMFAYYNAIKQGVFPPSPREDNCDNCRMRRLCRYEVSRIDSKINNFRRPGNDD